MGLGTKILLRSADRIEDPLMSPLKGFADKTFYSIATQAQFCAGSTPKEISRTVSSLHSLNYKGIILTYAREVETTDKLAVSTTVDNANKLLDHWIRILSQTENTRHLILNGRWEGATQDLAAIKAEALAEAQAAERRNAALR
ncbi:hypothetical protein RUND412_007400 [Rhizina undulata]